MPTDSPSESVSVALLAGREASIARPNKGWPSHVYLEISQPPGFTGPPLIFDKWPVGNPNGRKLLLREANLSEAEVISIDAQAIRFRDLWINYEQAAAEQAAAEEQAAQERERTRKNPTAADWGPLEIQCWCAATKNDKRSILVSSFDEFVQLCEQPQGAEVHLQWSYEDTNRLINLDCDFHQQQPPPGLLDELMTSLQPTPPIRHRTNRGFHAWYAPLDGLRADDLAAAAAAHLTLSSTFRAYGGTVEIIHRTKHPKSLFNGKIYGPLQRLLADTNIPLLQIFDRVACTDSERDEVMAKMGLRLGHRLSHAYCPIDPHHASTSSAPVVVSEHGIHCFSCAGRLGNGFVSWGSLRRQHGLPTMAAGDTSIMRDAIKHWAPHAHVSRLFEAMAPHFPKQFYRSLHRVLLCKAHADQVGLLDMLRATLSSDFPFVRNDAGLWCHEGTLRPTSPRMGRSALSACSMALRPVQNDEGEVTLKPDPNLLTMIEANGPVPGLFPLSPTVLSPIWHIHHQTTRPGCLMAQPRDPGKDPLRYLKPSERMPLEEAQAAIETRWPNMPWGYLTLLHVARGWGEEGTSQMPMIWATGETSSGKTSTLDIECALHDETPLRLTIPHDRVEALDEKVAAAQRCNGFLLLDDFCKNLSGKLGMARLDNTTAFLLRFNRSVGFHEMYVGEMTARVTTPLVMTDMRHPAELVQNEQIGRRVVIVHLGHAVQWGGAVKGFSDWWRGDLRKAAESWHSWVIDQYFGDERPKSFIDVAKELGFPLLRDMYGQQEDAHSREHLVKEFVQGLLRCPEASGLVAGIREQTSEQVAVTRARGPGWVILSSRARRPLEEAASTLCHSLNYDHIVVDGLKKALEPYQPRLHDMMPFNEPVRIDVEGYRRDAVLVRLRAAKRACPLRIGTQTLAPEATVDNLLSDCWHDVEEDVA
jgi:hypothetical protein